MIKTENFEKVEIISQNQLRDWLERNHQQKESVWLITFKKIEAAKYVSTGEVLDELICFGWIDGIRRKLDEKRTMQLISPRKVEHWAKSYKERAVKLIQEGKMHAAGLKTIEVSKSNGLWNFMDDVDNLIIPEDLAKELSKIAGASAFFQSINDSSKRFALRWIKLAKTDKTRINRIQKLVDLSAKGQKLPGS
ncbi:MAG: YdeI/OmpD-associated family protein [Bacteroidetes bacterium]|nr:YdeI/OmpD-associated family protein [Bacteroidota bacterium]